MIQAHLFISHRRSDGGDVTRRIERAIAELPETFRLRAWGSRQFRVAFVESYVSPRTSAVMLSIEIQEDDGHSWRPFCIAAPAELQAALA